MTSALMLALWKEMMSLAHYDPMISKLIVRGANREEALRKLAAALEQYEVAGPVTNIEFLKTICKSPDFIAGDVETGYIERTP